MEGEDADAQPEVPKTPSKSDHAPDERKATVAAASSNEDVDNKDRKTLYATMNRFFESAGR